MVDNMPDQNRLKTPMKNGSAPLQVIGSFPINERWGDSRPLRRLLTGARLRAKNKKMPGVNKLE